MQNPLVRITYCMPAVGLPDQGHRVEVLRRAAVLGAIATSATTIAANPSTILAIARLGDREKETLIRDLADGTIDPSWEIPRRRPPGAAAPRPDPAPDDAARRLEAIVERTGRLLPSDYWPNLYFLANWTGGTMGAYLRGYPEFFGDRPVRDVGLIASEGRMTIPIEDGTPAGILDIRHHYFEFIPEDQADRDEPETVEAAELIEGRQLLHPADHRRRALSLPDLTTSSAASASTARRP